MSVRSSSALLLSPYDRACAERWNLNQKAQKQNRRDEVRREKSMLVMLERVGHD